MGVAKTAITSRERLAVLRPRHGVLTVHTVYWPDEIQPGPAPTMPVTDRELEFAEMLLTHLKGIDPGAVRDEYAEALDQLVAAATAGRELEGPRRAARASSGPDGGLGGEHPRVRTCRGHPAMTKGACCGKRLATVRASTAASRRRGGRRPGHSFP